MIFSESELRAWDMLNERLKNDGYVLMDFEGDDGAFRAINDFIRIRFKIKENDYNIINHELWELHFPSMHQMLQFLIKKRSQVEQIKNKKFFVDNIVNQLNVELFELKQKFNKNLAVSNTNTVNHPQHYNTASIECIKLMLELYGLEAVKSFCKCNALKYLYRADTKNGLEDIKKAAWYLNKIVEVSKNDE